MINKMTHKERDKTNMIECLQIKNVMEYSAKSIVNEFGRYFSTIGGELARKIPQPKHSISTYIQNIPPNPKSIFLSPTSKEEIERLIEGLQNKKSSGHDNISNLLLKELKTAISTPLDILFNKSITTCIFPDNMKHGDIVPLYKSKERYLTTNYRPISLLTTISKILEKIMYVRTYSFLNNTNQLYKGQYGFRSKHSTESAISELIGNISKGLHNNKYTIGVFLDLSKAFDTLNHKILLQKLDKYGIRGLAKNWFASYLNNRKQRVKCTPESTGKLVYSEYNHVHLVTPQGSCLGPLLFIIFTNDFYLATNFVNSLLFADDTTLYQSHKKLSYLKWQIEEDLKTTMDWFRANQLTLNISKTVCILFSPNTKIQTINIEIGDKLIISEETTKFLGMWIDRSLNWKKHMSTLISKVKQNTNMLKINNKYLSIHAKKLIYHSHIMSHLLNGLLLWGNMVDNTTMQKIQNCLDKCYNLITHKKSTPANMKEDGFLSIRDLLTIENCKLAYKQQHEILPENIGKLMNTDSKNKLLTKSHHYSTRHKNDLNIPQAKYKLYHTSYLCKALSAYTLMPLAIKGKPSLKSFVNSLKRHLLST